MLPEKYTDWCLQFLMLMLTTLSLIQSMTSFLHSVSNAGNYLIYFFEINRNFLNPASHYIQPDIGFGHEVLIGASHPLYQHINQLHVPYLLPMSRKVKNYLFSAL